MCTGVKTMVGWSDKTIRNRLVAYNEFHRISNRTKCVKEVARNCITQLRRRQKNYQNLLQRISERWLKTFTCNWYGVNVKILSNEQIRTTLHWQRKDTQIFIRIYFFPWVRLNTKVKNLQYDDLYKNNTICNGMQSWVNNHFLSFYKFFYKLDIKSKIVLSLKL